MIQRQIYQEKHLYSSVCFSFCSSLENTHTVDMKSLIWQPDNQKPSLIQPGSLSGMQTATPDKLKKECVENCLPFPSHY